MSRLSAARGFVSMLLVFAVGFSDATVLSAAGQRRALDDGVLPTAYGAIANALAGWKADREPPPPVSEFLAWAKSASIPLGSAHWDQIDPTALRFLDRDVHAKRLVYIGETHHWLREKYDFRLMLIRSLFAKGWTTLGMEMGRSDGLRIDRYLEMGDESYLKQVGIYSFGGPFAQAEFAFWRSVRSISESRSAGTQRLHYFGYDLDMLPGNGFEDIRAMLQPYDGAPVVSHVLSMIRDLPGKLSQQEAEQRVQPVIDCLDASRQALEAEVGPPLFQTVRLSVLNLRDSYKYARLRRSAQNDRAAMVEREMAMCREMDHFLQSHPNHRVMLMGHAMHLSKHSDDLWMGPVGGGWGKMWPSIGSHIERSLPGRTYSIWMIHGAIAMGNPAVPGEIETLGKILSPIGPVFFLPLQTTDPRVAWLQQPLNFAVNMGADNPSGEGFDNGIVSRQADAIFFVRRATPIW